MDTKISQVRPPWPGESLKKVCHASLRLPARVRSGQVQVLTFIGKRRDGVLQGLQLAADVTQLVVGGRFVCPGLDQLLFQVADLLLEAGERLILED